MNMTTTTFTSQLVDQLDFHWTHALRPRLEGLTDDEYFWQPVSGCWTVHRDGGIDFAYPPPEPAPFTTIAWRLAHVIVGVFAMRNHSHFGASEAGYETWPYATDAATALRQLDKQYRMPTIRWPLLFCTSTARSFITVPKSPASEIFTSTPRRETEYGRDAPTDRR